MRSPSRRQRAPIQAGTFGQHDSGNSGESLTRQEPTTATGVGLLVNEPFPSCPFELLPQHFSPRCFVRAQVCEPPTAMAVIPLVRPETSTGRLLSLVVPLPS